MNANDVFNLCASAFICGPCSGSPTSIFSNNGNVLAQTLNGVEFTGVISDNFYDTFDWLLFGYHLLLLVLTIIGVRLFIRVLRQLPGRDYRKRLAIEQDNVEDTIALLTGAATSMRRANTTAGEGATHSLQQHEDRLKTMLGHSRMVRERLRTIRAVLLVLTFVAVILTIGHWLGHLSAEKHPAPWAYHDSLNHVLAEALWGITFFATVYLLELWSGIVLADYSANLERQFRKVANQHLL